MRRSCPGASAQPSRPTQSATVVSVDGYACRGDRRRRSKRMVESPVPRMLSTLTGWDGWHFVRSFHMAPLSAAIAVMMSAWSQAMRKDMKAPLECPTR